jgi:ubiquinone/menaquinone biosynthesis C-methylase UbiE
MGRLLRIALIACTIAVAYAAARFVVAWRDERRRKEVFPASQSRFLLQPARRLVMPVRRTLKRFSVGRGQTVLEVGPGPGYYTLEAASMVGPTGRLLCLDIQRGMIDLLSARLAERGVENVGLIVADATHLPLRDACVGTAFLVTVLGEVPRPEAALRELRRVLGDGGNLGLTESFGDPDYVRVGALRAMCGEAGFREKGHWREILGYTSRFVAAG